jgi:alpha-beta hydrolase superfamily lysophospholipase
MMRRGARRRGVSWRTYVEHRYWRRYQPHVPERFRVSEEDLPTEEAWAWNGCSVHLDRYDRPDAALTVIGLHGGGGYGRLMAPIGLLARRAGFEAVLPDLPGYGLTATPQRCFTYDTWVRCVRDLALAERDRAQRPVLLIGASMGGMLAWHATAAGADVAGIVATTLIDPRDREVLRALGRWRWTGPVAARAFHALRPLTDPIPVHMGLAANMRAIANTREVAALACRDPQGGGKVVPARFLRTWIDYRPRHEPEQSRVPLLLAHPADDRWTPTALSERFLSRLAGAKRVVLLARCGHFPLEEPGLTTLEREFHDFAHSVLR